MTAESFTGFTPSDLRKLKSAVASKPKKDVQNVPLPSSKFNAHPSTLLTLSSKKPKRKEKYMRHYDKNEINLSDEQRLSSVSNGARIVQHSSDEESSESELPEKECSLEKTPPATCKEPTLEDFESRQKQMEEQNKKRRALLTQAIRERTKKTKAEQEKLLEIQKDLNKLDQLLSMDVSIIRDKIDAASLEFDEAQKRYDKSEKEFVEAKLNLFKKMEKKERLTEYLCTLIEQNEIRKSDKLSGLMDQLEMEVATDSSIEKSMPPVLPQLCSMNDIIYNNCSTIKDPNCNKSETSEEPSTGHDDHNAKPDRSKSEIADNLDEKRLVNHHTPEKQAETESDEVLCKS